MAKKQCLVVVGNIASGKTAVCMLWVYEFKEFCMLSLDNWRFSMTGKMGYDREQAAQNAALQMIGEDDHIIFETTGTGRFFDRAMRLLIERGYDITMIQLQCDPFACLQRFYNRSTEGYILPPFPYTFKPQAAIQHIASEHRHLQDRKSVV